MRLEKQGNERAAIVNRLLQIRERFIGALLLGNNAVNIAASALATGVFLGWFGEVGVIYATIFMTALLVIFAEVLPKTAAINAPDRIALMVAKPIAWVVRLFGARSPWISLLRNRGMSLVGSVGPLKRMLAQPALR